LLWPGLDRPLFIVGAPRSGTTFLGRCIGALPEISYHFEPIATKAVARAVYEGTATRGRLGHVYRGTYRWLMRLHGDGDLRFAEKTPRNCFLIDFLSDEFPESQFVHIVRDGRDVTTSLREKPWLRAESRATDRREPGGYRYGPYPRFWVEPQRREEFGRVSDERRCAWSWRRHTECARDAAPDLGPSRYLEVRYEDLVDTPELWAARILDFIGIALEDSRRRFLDVVAGASAASVGRWRDELTAEQLADVRAEAGELLDDLGYR
jgi:hypothetical protein